MAVEKCNTPSSFTSPASTLHRRLLQNLRDLRCRQDLQKISTDCCRQELRHLQNLYNLHGRLDLQQRRRRQDLQHLRLLQNYTGNVIDGIDTVDIETGAAIARSTPATRSTRRQKLKEIVSLVVSRDQSTTQNFLLRNFESLRHLQHLQ